jgi:hypothetical protein
LSELFVERGAPDCLRSDNGSEFAAQPVREWLQRFGVETLFVEPGSPWENGCIESFNGQLRDELLNGEIFDTILEARVITERWRKTYNTVRPHSSLGCRLPAPQARYPLGVPMAERINERIIGASAGNRSSERRWQIRWRHYAMSSAEIVVYFIGIKSLRYE